MIAEIYNIDGKIVVKSFLSKDQKASFEEKGNKPIAIESVNTTESPLAQLAQSEMITELNWCDLQIKLHASSDKRAVSTLDDIYAYARACRDYVQNVDGELTIVGDKPERPS